MQEYEITPGTFATILAVICISSATCMFFYMDNVKQTEIASLTEKCIVDMNTINTTHMSEIEEVHLSCVVEMNNLNSTHEDEKTLLYIVFRDNMNVLNFTHTLEQENLTSDFVEEMSQLNISHETTYGILYESFLDVGFQLENITDNTDYYLHDPTLEEAESFLFYDKTDEIPYVYEEFVCHNFASTVNNNSEEQGIRCGIVLINYCDYSDCYGHTLVCFNTTDEGIVYFEVTEEDTNMGDKFMLFEYYVGLGYYVTTFSVSW